MKLSTLIIPLALTLGFTGCETTGVVEPEPAFSDIGLTHHRKDLVLKDVPLPEDFLMSPGTFFHGTDNFRYGELMYQGNLSVDDIFFYYKKQMPSHGWKEVSLKQFETNGRLAYTKNGEKCTILLREGATMTEIKIIVEQIKMEQNPA